MLMGQIKSGFSLIAETVAQNPVLAHAPCILATRDCCATVFDNSAKRKIRSSDLRISSCNF
jgi:hypothetical protein